MKGEANGEPLPSNGTDQPTNPDRDDADEHEDEDEPALAETTGGDATEDNERPSDPSATNVNADDDWESRYAQTPHQNTSSSARSNGVRDCEDRSVTSPSANNGATGEGAENMASDTRDKLDALVKEREALMVEVTELRKSLQSIQEKHEQEVAELQEQLEESQTAKEQADTNYNDLLGRVGQIKSHLGERLKSDAVGF